MKRILMTVAVIAVMGTAVVAYDGYYLYSKSDINLNVVLAEATNFFDYTNLDEVEVVETKNSDLNDCDTDDFLLDTNQGNITKVERSESKIKSSQTQSLLIVKMIRVV